MSLGRAAETCVANKPVGPVGYGLLGLIVPWAPLEPEVAAGLMKKALEQGANLWNSVRFYIVYSHRTCYLTIIGHLLRHASCQFVAPAALLLRQIPRGYR
jgi:hypothetical protein